MRVLNVPVHFLPAVHLLAAFRTTVRLSVLWHDSSSYVSLPDCVKRREPLRDAPLGRLKFSSHLCSPTYASGFCVNFSAHSMEQNAYCRPRNSTVSAACFGSTSILHTGSQAMRTPVAMQSLANYIMRWPCTGNGCVGFANGCRPAETRAMRCSRTTAAMRIYFSEADSSYITGEVLTLPGSETTAA